MSPRAIQGFLLFLVVLCLGMTGCSSQRGPQYSHGHYHDYRHGYYNPVDGYFHDDHWHKNGNKTKNYRGDGRTSSYHYY